MYEIKTTARFRRDLKAICKDKGKNLRILQEAVDTLAAGKPLPAKYRDHALTGSFSRYRECHLQPDWLLMYEICNDIMVLVLVRTGSHAKLGLA